VDGDGRSLVVDEIGQKKIGAGTAAAHGEVEALTGVAGSVVDSLLAVDECRCSQRLRRYAAERIGVVERKLNIVGIYVGTCFDREQGRPCRLHPVATSSQ
jgi:hypothetical protein